mmetsp:Transcript_25847/g.80631  ORF Transcript_25847/g.80631 Transcript_25847/m.80631 type:complete len:290 (-) Transcript_25847:442-1311(-)
MREHGGVAHVTPRGVLLLLRTRAVHVHVEPQHRDPLEAVHAPDEEAGERHDAVHASGDPAVHLHGVHAVARGHGRPHPDSHHLGLLLDVAHVEVGQVEVRHGGRLVHNPSRQGHRVVAQRPVGVGHPIAAVHQELARRQRQGHGRRARVHVLPGVEDELAALVVDEVHEAQLPLADKLEVRLQHPCVHVLLREHLLEPVLVLSRPGQRRPDHALPPARGLEAHGLGCPGRQGLAEARQLLVELGERPWVRVLVQGQAAESLVLQDADLAFAAPAEVVRQHLRLQRRGVR